MRAIGASEKIAERHRGQDQLAERGAERLELAGDQAVDQIEAGDLRRRRIEHVKPAERRRRPAEQIVEYVDQQQPGEEHRQRDAGRGREAAEMIDPGIRPRCRENAERQRDRHGDEQTEQGQLGRGRKAVADLGRNRLAGGQRVAEIAARKVSDIAAELHGQRFVEPEVLADLLDRFLGRCRTREIRRRIARQRTREQERHDHDPDQARDREHQPLCDHAKHETFLARLTLHKRAVIEPAVEPVLVAGHVLLHCDVRVGLEQRDARDVGIGEIDEALHVPVVGRLVAGRGRFDGAVDQLVESPSTDSSWC